MLRAALLALAARDAVGGQVRLEPPVPLQAIDDVLGVVALEQAVVVGVHEARHVEPLGAGQAVAAAGAEPVEGVEDPVAHGRDVGLVVGREALDGGAGLVHVLLGREAHQGGGDGRVGDVEPQRRRDHRRVAVAPDEREALGVPGDQPAAEGVHGGHAEAHLAGELDGLLSVREVHRAVAEGDALERAFPQDVGQLLAGQVRRDDHVLDEALFLGPEGGGDGPAFLPLPPLLGLDQAPDVEEVDPLQPEALKALLQALAEGRAVGGHALARGVERARGHVPEGRAQDVLAPVLAVARGGVEVVDAPAVGVPHDLGVGVDVGRVGESHPAEADHGYLLAGLSVRLGPHPAKGPPAGS